MRFRRTKERIKQDTENLMKQAEHLLVDLKYLPKNALKEDNTLKNSLLEFSDVLDKKIKQLKKSKKKK